MKASRTRRVSVTRRSRRTCGSLWKVELQATLPDRAFSIWSWAPRRCSSGGGVPALLTRVALGEHRPRTVFVNDAAVRLLGYERDELLGEGQSSGREQDLGCRGPEGGGLRLEVRTQGSDGGCGASTPRCDPGRSTSTCVTQAQAYGSALASSSIFRRFTIDSFGGQGQTPQTGGR